MFLEKQIKDDFNTFYPVKFENEKAEDDPEHFEDDYERIEQKKKDLIDHIYTRRIDRHYNPPNMISHRKEIIANLTQEFDKYFFQADHYA
jgi:ABC-type enterochelin transport system substrate-binding protein|tara:strand:+ start:167 stop:436 length:270 start_codon:yes stop_codon:yes gene_type:complete